MYVHMRCAYTCAVILNPEVPFSRQPFKHTTHASVQSRPPCLSRFFVRRWVYAFATVLGDTNDATGIYRAVCTYSVLQGVPGVRMT